jgi:hypothetical protein
MQSDIHTGLSRTVSHGNKSLVNETLLSLNPPTFYGTLRFIRVLTKSSNQCTLTYTHTSYLRVSFSQILPPTPVPAKWSLLFCFFE